MHISFQETYRTGPQGREIAPEIEREEKPPRVQAPVAEPRSEPALEPSRPQGSLTDIDWAAVILGLLALLAVGGLIPFWLWVYYVYNPPLP